MHIEQLRAPRAQRFSNILRDLGTLSGR